MIDTTNVIIYDSSTIVKNGKDQIILITDETNGQKNGLFDNPIISSVLIPVIVAGISALIINLINRKRNKEEINKIKLEAEQIKRDFQPLVLSTLQETHKEIFKTKLMALKSLVNMSKNYYNYDHQYYYGELVFGDAHDYYTHVYTNFGKTGYGEFQKFLADYEYLFPKSVIDEFTPIKKAIDKLYDSNKYSDSLRQNMMTEEDEKRIKELPEFFGAAIEAIRNDLHLDNTFIHNFLSKYDIKE